MGDPELPVAAKETRGDWKTPANAWGGNGGGKNRGKGNRHQKKEGKKKIISGTRAIYRQEWNVDLQGGKGRRGIRNPVLVWDHGEGGDRGGVKMGGGDPLSGPG